ncbi:hypothetical protein FQN54_003307 [Arachnomyces sp. PD_36]|nr:hypothetical protein FQN54_003307 [Arachnomyces sp. PD_36]
MQFFKVFSIIALSTSTVAAAPAPAPAAEAPPQLEGRQFAAMCVAMYESMMAAWNEYMTAVAESNIDDMNTAWDQYNTGKAAFDSLC